MDWSLGIYITLFIGLYFEVFLLISFIEHQPAKKTTARPTHFPRVSMVVPCWNEETTVAGTLDSLLALDYPKDKLEILVIDDGSTDKTGEIVTAYHAKHPHIILHRKENGGKYSAMNWGIEHSSGELIGFLDADSFVAEDGLIEMVKTFQEKPEMMALAPSMKVFRPRRMIELMQQVEYTFGVFYKKMFDNLSAISVLPGPFSIYRREVFEKIGLFRHAHNTEDMEMTFRMHAHGLKLSNAHTAHVYTTVPKTTWKLVKQRTRWSQGFLQNSQEYSFMYLNPRFGNFGMVVLPFGLIAFASALYCGGYVLLHLGSSIINRALDLWATRIPPHLTAPHLEWFYLNTSMMTFLILITLSMTFFAVYVGNTIVKNKLTLKSYLSYFLLFGFIAPVWLARAAWGALRAQESSWR